MEIIKVKMKIYDSQGEYIFIGYFYNYVELQIFKEENYTAGKKMEILGIKRVEEMPKGQGQEW